MMRLEKLTSIIRGKKFLDNEETEELYNNLFQAYMGVHGGRSLQVLEHKIASLIKKGFSRAEAISKLAEKEQIGDLTYEKKNGITSFVYLLIVLIIFSISLYLGDQESLVMLTPVLIGIAVLIFGLIASIWNRHKSK
jgi:hypothetical protein